MSFSSNWTPDATQREVIHIARGAYLVLAPPGCGKTQSLAERIAVALDSGVKSGDMLCLTFTNRAARSMRERVGDRIGEDKAGGVFVGNVHRYCARFLYENGIKPTWIVGDFDTAAPELVAYYRTKTEIPIRQFNPVKDATDSQIAIELALELGSGEITILGGTGTRLDHVLGNIQSLMLAKKKGVSCVILDEYNRIRLVDGTFKLKKEEQYGRYVSLLPLTTEVTGVELTGVKYPLSDYTFTSTGSAGLGVSNEITAETAEIRVKSGVFILIESSDQPKKFEIL